MNTPAPEMKTCKQCGQPMASDAPEGLCARCLLSAAVKGSDAGTSATAQPAAPPISEIAAHFPQLEILELLGRGGMGMVYKARQPALDRLVALKILPQESAGDPHFAERFTREARALARLNHPNIVGVYEFGERDGLFYFVMEYVDGPNLRHLIQTRSIKAVEALAIVPKICEALQFAHEEGVMHRDIKPENILIDKKGRVKIADFGLAKILGIETGDLALTQTGMSLGTPRYMAPEQIEHPEDVDHRADIYSLGVVFYEMLTGELPIGRFAPPSQKVEVDVRLDDVVLRSLEKDVLRRYQHASEIKSDMENIASKPGIAAAAAPTLPTSGPQKVAPARLSRTALFGAAWTAVGMIAAILLTVGLFFVRSSSVRSEGMSFVDLIIILPLVAAAASAPFGTTICGAVALAQIKRSEGRLYGLRLAAADLLFYPTLLLFSALLCGLIFLAKAGGGRVGPGELVIIATGVLIGLVFTFRGAWRSASGKRSAAASISTPTSEVRLSRCALIGAIWAFIGVPAAIMLCLAIYSAPKGIALGGILHLPVGLWAAVAFSAPIGSMILGGLALGQIKRSGGTLYGLPLAAIALLAHPLAALGAGAFGLTHLVQIAIWTKVHMGYVYGSAPNIISPPAGSYPGTSFMVLDALIASCVCVFAGRIAWQTVARSADDQSAAQIGKR